MIPPVKLITLPIVSYQLFIIKFPQLTPCPGFTLPACGSIHCIVRAHRLPIASIVLGMCSQLCAPSCRCRGKYFFMEVYMEDKSSNTCIGYLNDAMNHGVTAVIVKGEK